VAEDRIKSALEIAMEKVAKMPALTPQEIREQKEREYAPRGEVLARKYLDKAFRETDLEIELGKYRGEEAQIVRKAFLSTLCQSIKLGDYDRSQRALEGIRVLDTGLDYEQVKQEYTEISGAFQQAEEQTFKVLEGTLRDKLREYGISGSAVKVNIKGNRDVQNGFQQIRQTYESRLNELKGRLLAALSDAV